MITLFDIPFHTPNIPWSPNTLKTSFSLGLKGLPYQTQWVEYPDIAAVLKAHGIGPSTTNRLGEAHYTLPAILDTDESTGEVKAALAESYDIAEYLDAAYPDTKIRLLPIDEEARRRVTEFTRGGGLGRLMRPLFGKMRFATLHKLNEASRAHFSRARAMDMWDAYPGAKRLEDIPISDEEFAALWEGAKESFGVLDGILRETDGEGMWYLGKEPSFADCAIGALLVWIRNVCGEDSEEWRKMREVNGGRWERYLGALRELGAAI